MGTQSAGILLYRFTDGDLEVLLVHPGGPYFARKDAGVWSMPKGEFEENEAPLTAARREFAEEMGAPVPDGVLMEIGQARQLGGKTVHAWALEADFDAAAVRSNAFTIEWPPKSGNIRAFPEVDRAAWLPLDQAREKIVPGQLPFLAAVIRR